MLEPWQRDTPCTANGMRSRGSPADSQASAACSSGFEQLDVLFLGFLTFTLIVEALR